MVTRLYFYMTNRKKKHIKYVNLLLLFFCFLMGMWSWFNKNRQRNTANFLNLLEHITPVILQCIAKVCIPL